MAKSKIIFRCSNCGASFPRWQGRCSTCNNWDTLVEEKEISGIGGGSVVAKVQRLSDVEGQHAKRLSSGIKEFDEVVGGGIVSGSLILLGGDPGVGKSTLALDIATGIKAKVLYVSGEESLYQLKMRSQRLDKQESMYVLAETDLGAILAAIEQLSPELVIIDSIQTMYSEQASGVAGSVSQVSFATQSIMRMAKSRHISFILIGHVTKEGYLAGPKTLEHMVDTVLYLEGERFASFRVLRSVKNRFGNNNEVGVFEMTSTGLNPVKNPSEMFLQEGDRAESGNVVTAIVEGSRALLLEIQALNSKTSFGYPKRTTSGYDLNRLQLISAIISKRLGLNLSDQDLYVNVVGGMKISDPSADLAVAMAIISGVKNFSLANVVVIGELGLSGEIRTVPNLEKRVKEAEKLGFESVLIPTSKITSTKIKILKAKSLKDAVKLLS
ncbi:MAG: DNA repair protein RadA [Candidatus Doudnabacteria bacterium]